MTAEKELARRLADAARDLHRPTDPQQVMDRVVLTAVALVPGAEEATITMAQGRRHVFSAATTGDRGRQLDALQAELGEGPCVTTLLEETTVRVDDMPAEERWPALAARAPEIGVRSLLCLQLFVHGDTLGALDLISTQPGAFTDESEQVGLLLAAHASVAVAGAQKIEHVSTALASRDVIGQAKGILMERFKITADQAFGVLAKVSQDSNRKLYAVAEELANTGALPARRP
jgi:GAF domain-containing protein